MLSPLSALCRRTRAVLRVIVPLCATLLSCVRHPYPTAGRVVAEIELSGLPSDSETAQVLEGLATVSSKRFLGLWDGVVFEYEVYNEQLLRLDIERVERYLQARGYYEARVLVARVSHHDEHHVRIYLRVALGPPVTIGNIVINGIEKLPIEIAGEILEVATLRSGKPFDEAHYKQTQEAILSELRNRGYAFAQLSPHAKLDLANHTANIQLSLSVGQPAVFGAISIEGLHRVPEHTLRKLVSIKTGAAYSQSELIDAQRRLSGLGLFYSVRITADLKESQREHIPINIKIEESPLRLVRLAAGAELDALRLANHINVGWEHRNFLGALRHLQVETQPGLVYFPTRLGNRESPNRVLFENKLHLELQQPAFLENGTTGILTSDFNVFPLLFAQTNADEGLLGFAEVKTSAALARPFWNHRLLLSPSYNWQLDMPVDYKHLALGKRINADIGDLENLKIAFGELSAHLDLRDNPLSPQKGAFFSANLQLARTYLGGDISDFRIKPEARVYWPISKSVTFAQRVSFGFLFPRNYGATLNETEDPVSDRQVARDQQILLFRGFFSGGANSNRGYPLRAVGPHGPVPFLFGDRPLGGITLWEASWELRIPLVSSLRGVLFADTSNVIRRHELALNAPHLSIGAGLRYFTPIGPLRLDVGYRVPGWQVPAEDSLPEPTSLAGIPLALHLSLGEAF